MKNLFIVLLCLFLLAGCGTSKKQLSPEKEKELLGEFGGELNFIINEIDGLLSVVAETANFYDAKEISRLDAYEKFDVLENAYFAVIKKLNDISAADDLSKEARSEARGVISSLSGAASGGVQVCKHAKKFIDQGSLEDLNEMKRWVRISISEKAGAETSLGVLLAK
jgi:hypothetical protein